LKFLIAGLGSIGRRHLRNLVALGERDIHLYRTHRSTLPNNDLTAFPVKTDLAAALALQPDAVIISNPTACHLKVALPAAHAGCHLLMEKPVADRLDAQVNALQQMVNDRNLQTLVGYQFRFHPVLLQLRELLTTGVLGKVYSFRVHWGEYLPGWHPWEDYRGSYAARKDLGGGVVNTLSHPIDYARWLFGEVSALYARTGHLSSLELDVEDTVEIILEFMNGTLGSIHLDYYQRPPSHWMEVSCEGGQIRWDNDTGIGQVYYVDGDRREELTPPLGFERNDLFLDEMRHFIALIKGESLSRCSLSDGIRTLELCEAVHRSASQNSQIQL